MAKDELRERIEQLLAFPINEAATRSDLGALDFKAIVPSAVTVQTLVALLKDFEFESLPQEKVLLLSNKIQELHAALQQMKSFQITTPDASSQRPNYENNVRTKTKDLYDVLTPIIAVHSAISDTTAARAQERETRMADNLKAIDEAKVKAQSTLAAIEGAAGRAGVVKEATHFADEAAEHKRSAYGWLAATIVLVIATIIWGGIALFAMPIAEGATLGPILQNIVGKLIVFTALYYALLWCARNYRASRHNYVVNKHRKTSLSTFETFVHAAGKDDVTKNAVLLQATTSIFSAQSSGYIQSDTDSDQPNKIFEITRSIAGSKPAS